MNKYLAALIFISATVSLQSAAQNPLRLGIAGISHGHVGSAYNASDREDLQIVGIFESDPELRKSNALARKFPSAVYGDLEKMLDETRPEAVMAYGSIYDHLAVVEACAPRGIHVMVEKPLAVNPEHAARMAELARKHNILLLTNYETTWYPANHKAYQMVRDGRIGEVTRINVFDGHEGPVEIGCSPEFLAWLTDPVLNGGGAVIDFGCYGANLATWIMQGEKPVSVYAVLKQQKPHVYPKVDDDATIVVEYRNATVEIMASWNWPTGRKDMHIYGANGYIYQDNSMNMRYMLGGDKHEERLARLQAPYDDPFRYLKAAVRREIEVTPADLSSLENNLIVVNILNAAIESSRTKKAVSFE